MPNYFDPSTALPDPSTYAQHGPFGISMPSFLGYQAAANRRETVAPFLQRAGQEDELALQKQQTDVGEYTGQEAIAQRSAQRQSQTATSLQEALTAPLKGELERGQTKQKLAVLPLQNEKERADLALAVAKAKGTPAGEALNIMGSLHGDMEAAKGNPFAENEIKVRALNMFKEKFPGLEVPEQLLAAKSDMYHAAYSAMVHTAQYEQEMAKGEQTQKGQTQRTGMEVAGRQQVAEAQLAASRTPEQAANWATNQLRKLPKNHPDRDSIEQQLDQANDALAEADLKNQYRPIDSTSPMILQATAKSLAAQFNLSPEETAKMVKDALPNYQAARDARKQELLAQRGVTMSFLRNRNPNKSDTEIRAFAAKNKIRIIE